MKNTNKLKPEKNIKISKYALSGDMISKIISHVKEERRAW